MICAETMMIPISADDDNNDGDDDTVCLQLSNAAADKGVTLPQHLDEGTWRVGHADRKALDTIFLDESRIYQMSISNLAAMHCRHVGVCRVL